MTRDNSGSRGTNPQPLPIDIVTQEVWEGEYDFAYLDETYQFSDTVNIDVHAASKDIKKTFRFPSSEPSENLIIDDRPTVKKVADYNYCKDCLKCQVLNQVPCLTKIQV